MTEPKHVDDMDAEDGKLATLARAARARTGASEAAAVRDSDGRTYVACTVDLPSFSVNAMQGAIVAALSSGAQDIEAAAIVTDYPGVSSKALHALRDVNELATIYVVHPDGEVVDRLP